MAGKVDLKLLGADSLEAALRELGGKVSGRLGANAVRAGARVIVNRAKRNIKAQGLVESGDLLRSVRVFTDVSERRLGGSERSAYAGTRVFYGRFAEFGTAHQAAQPWLRPALDEGAQDAVNKLVDNLGKGIERETAKYKGRR